MPPSTTFDNNSFQRPYVWNEEQQWDPLWKDLERVATRLLRNPHTKHEPHFLGAVVLQHVQNPVGELQERMIIDGQQRLTTLQILLDALHAELHRIEAGAPSGGIVTLIVLGRKGPHGFPFRRPHLHFPIH